jgi:hypothetical protein
MSEMLAVNGNQDALMPQLTDSANECREQIEKLNAIRDPDGDRLHNPQHTVNMIVTRHSISMRRRWWMNNDCGSRGESE